MPSAEFSLEDATLMARDGAGPDSVAQRARKQGLAVAETILVLRHVFQLSLEQAKDILVRTEKLGSSISDYQGKLESVIERELKSLEEVDRAGE